MLRRSAYLPAVRRLLHSRRKNLLPFILLLGASILLASLAPGAAAAPLRSDTAVVRAVLFYSPTCGHCHIVMTEDLPPLKEKYGWQLDILEINAQDPAGRQLYGAALEAFQPKEPGVPMMVIGDTSLLGSVDIPEQLPGLIEAGLEAGGVDWPAIPGLESALAKHTSPPIPVGSSLAAVQVPVPDSENVEGPLWLAKFNRDPVGNGIAVAVLLAMVFSIVALGVVFLRTEDVSQARGPAAFAWPGWAIPVLCILGLGVAGYLSFVEITHTEAVCGPVGDCNTVQESPFATLWGFIPVGVLGMLGYAAILTAWAVRRISGSQVIKRYASIAMWSVALIGTLFSVYLTFLEPFVIGATCAWCVTSAVLITLLLWATTRPALEALEG